MTENMKSYRVHKDHICSSFISEAGKFSCTWAKNINALVPSFRLFLSVCFFQASVLCIAYLQQFVKAVFFGGAARAWHALYLTMLLAVRVHGMNTSYLVQDITNYENDPSKFVSPSKQASHIVNGRFHCSGCNRACILVISVIADRVRGVARDHRTGKGLCGRSLSCPL